MPKFTIHYSVSRVRKVGTQRLIEPSEGRRYVISAKSQELAWAEVAQQESAASGLQILKQRVEPDGKVVDAADSGDGLLLTLNSISAE